MNCNLLFPPHLDVNGAAGEGRTLQLQVRILVLRLSRRDPGVTVQRHPYTPLAGIPDV